MLEFVDSHALDELAPLGTFCPDHFLRTKIRPLVLPFDSGGDNLDEIVAWLTRARRLSRRLRGLLRALQAPELPAMRDPNAVVYLVPGVGMLSFAKDKATARIAREFYVNAINVMRGAPASALMSACPSRKRSTSNIGCSRKPSCSACRSLSARRARRLYRRRGRHRPATASRR